MVVRLVNGKLVEDDGTEFDTPSMESVDPPAAVDDNPDGYPRCDGCGRLNYQWTPGQRGRKPRYHKDCKPIAPNRRGATGVRNEAALRESLEQRYISLARIASLWHPAYGAGIREKIEQAVNADLAYARVNPSFRRALERALDKTALGEVIAVHVAMVAPIAVGESAKRARAKGAAKSQGEGDKATPKPTGTQTKQTPPQPPRPDNVHPIREDDGYPEDSEPASPETVNAGAMPGMPG